MIFLKTKFWLHREEKQVKQFFYWHDRFKEIDKQLSLAYAYRNPYQISRKYLQKQGAEDIHLYGETPLTTMRRIVEECAIGPQDVVIEMGAGRGRTSFFLSEYIGCHVYAMEQIPEFVESAENIAKKFDCKKVHFSCRDMMEADFQKATVIYLYGTCLSDSTIEMLTDLLPSQIKIITVSYPLCDYSKNFVTLKQFSAPFPWGSATIYLNQKIEQ
ncbi:MAG TPA: methyltransferase domain-containing protein [Rhabdochlamydiaceae bacterium]|nr:methyltransferase domain-containing protein [Rhabdochlamydiaceae bacterium]